MLLLLAALITTPALAGRVLLIGEVGSMSPAPAEAAQFQWLHDLLGHFSLDIDTRAPEDYQPGNLDKYEAVVYLRVGNDTKTPPALLADLVSSKAPVCWIGSGIEQLLALAPKRFGFTVGPSDAAAWNPTRIHYRTGSYWRAGPALPTLTVTNSDNCEVLAESRGDFSPAPYIVRSGHLWYFPELPLGGEGKTGVDLILCDQMHEVLEKIHDVRPRAFLFLEGVTPSTDPAVLATLIKYIHGTGAAVAIEVSPIAGAVKLQDHRDLVSVLRGAQRTGASIIGTLPPPQPLGRWEPKEFAEVILRATHEFAACGLYPLAWSIEQDQLPRGYPYAEGPFCSTFVERVPATDELHLPRPLPLLTVAARRQLTTIQTGDFLLKQGRGEVEAILAAAHARTVIADPLLAIAIAPGAPPEAVHLLLDGLQGAGYDSYDLRYATNATKTDDLWILSVSKPQRLNRFHLPKDWEATIIQPKSGDRHVLHAQDTHAAGFMVEPGAMVVAYPAGQTPQIVPSLEGDVEQVTQRIVGRLAQFIAIGAIAAAGLLLLIYLILLVQRRET